MCSSVCLADMICVIQILGVMIVTAPDRLYIYMGNLFLVIYDLLYTVGTYLKLLREAANNIISLVAEMEMVQYCVSRK